MSRYSVDGSPMTSTSPIPKPYINSTSPPQLQEDKPVTITSRMVQSEIRIKELRQDSKDCFIQSLMKIYNNKELSDTKLLIGSESIPYYASRAILAVHSEVFQRLFESSSFLENTPLPQEEKILAVIQIPNIDPPIFDQILTYMHMGSFVLTDDTILPVFKAADQYLLYNLAKHCYLKFRNLLNDSTVFELLDQSISLHVDWATSFCVKYIAEKSKRLIGCPPFCRLSKPAVIAVTSSDALPLTEIEIVRAIKKWGEVNHNPQQDLKEIFKYVRIDQLSVKEIDEEIEKFDLVDKNQLFSIYKYKADSGINPAFGSKMRCKKPNYVTIEFPNFTKCLVEKREMKSKIYDLNFGFTFYLTVSIEKQTKVNYFALFLHIAEVQVPMNRDWYLHGNIKLRGMSCKHVISKEFSKDNVIWGFPNFAKMPVEEDKKVDFDILFPIMEVNWK